MRRAGLARPLTTLVVAAVAATGLVASPATAAEPNSKTATTVDVNELGRAVTTLEPYVSRSPSDGTFSLSAPSPVIESAGPDAYTAVLGGMELVNGLILAGVVESTNDLRAVPAGSGADGQQTGNDAGILNHGKNEITCSWVNCTLRLDAFWTNKLVSALAAGAGAAGIASLLAAAGVITSPGAIPSGLAAGVLAIGSAGVSFCSNSHGVWIRWGLGSWCGGQ